VANSEERGVLDESDYWVAGVDGVEALLEAIVTAIQ
jgi:hypothetical protein